MSGKSGTVIELPRWRVPDRRLARAVRGSSPDLVKLSWLREEVQKHVLAPSQPQILARVPRSMARHEILFSKDPGCGIRRFGSAHLDPVVHDRLLFLGSCETHVALDVDERDRPAQVIGK